MQFAPIGLIGSPVSSVAVTVSRAEWPLKHSLSIEEVPDRRAHYTERRTGNSAISAPDRGSLDNRSSAVPADMTGWGRARDPNRDQEIGQLPHSSFSCLSLLNPRHFMAQAQTRLAQPRCDCLLGQAQGRSQLCVRRSFHVTQLRTSPESDALPPGSDSAFCDSPAPAPPASISQETTVSADTFNAHLFSGGGVVLRLATASSY
jgi:hypothetical protein